MNKAAFVIILITMLALFSAGAAAQTNSTNIDVDIIGVPEGVKAGGLISRQRLLPRMFLKLRELMCALPTMISLCSVSS